MNTEDGGPDTRTTDEIIADVAELVGNLPADDGSARYVLGDLVLRACRKTRMARTMTRRLRKALLAHLKKHKAKVHGPQRVALNFEREHVRGLNADALAQYARERGFEVPS